MVDELLDIVDDQDIVVAREMRHAVHQRGLQHRGVHAFLFTVEGRLVVQRRSRNREAFPLALDCSVSEHVKAGESYLQAARRGLAEELGVQDIALRRLVKFSMVYGVNDYEISTLFEGRVDLASIRFDPQEVDEVGTFRLAELTAMISAGEPRFSGWFQQLLNWYMDKPSSMKVIRSYTKKQFQGR